MFHPYPSHAEKLILSNNINSVCHGYMFPLTRGVFGYIVIRCVTHLRVTNKEKFLGQTVCSRDKESANFRDFGGNDYRLRPFTMEV